MHGRQTTNSGSLEPSGGCFRDIGLQLDTRSVKLHETVDFTSDIRADHFDCKDEIVKIAQQKPKLLTNKSGTVLAGCIVHHIMTYFKTIKLI